MVAVDTNIIVRLLTKDNKSQFKQAYRIFEENEIFVSDTVILELEWVLRYSYKYKANDIYLSFQEFFGLANVYVADARKLLLALEWHNLGLDFADAFHLVNSQHCTAIYSFDSAFIKKAKDFSVCEVKLPD